MYLKRKTEREGRREKEGRETERNRVYLKRKTEREGRRGKEGRETERNRVCQLIGKLSLGSMPSKTQRD